MTTSTQYVAAPSNKARWAGRILSGLAIAFLVVDSFMKLAKTAPAVKGTAELGYPPSLLVPLGIRRQFHETCENCSGREGHRRIRLSAQLARTPWHHLAQLRGAVRAAKNLRSRGNLAHCLPGRRCCHPGPRRQPAVRLHFVPGIPGRDDLGWPRLARSGAASLATFS